MRSELALSRVLDAVRPKAMHLKSLVLEERMVAATLWALVNRLDESSLKHEPSSRDVRVLRSVVPLG